MFRKEFWCHQTDTFKTLRADLPPSNKMWLIFFKLSSTNYSTITEDQCPLSILSTETLYITHHYLNTPSPLRLQNIYYFIVWDWMVGTIFWQCSMRFNYLKWIAIRKSILVSIIRLVKCVSTSWISLLRKTVSTTSWKIWEKYRRKPRTLRMMMDMYFIIIIFRPLCIWLHLQGILLPYNFYLVLVETLKSDVRRMTKMF